MINSNQFFFGEWLLYWLLGKIYYVYILLFMFDVIQIICEVVEIELKLLLGVGGSVLVGVVVWL